MLEALLLRCDMLPPVATPQVAESPVVLRLIAIGSFRKESVDKELEDDPELIAFSIFVPRS